MKFVIFLLVCIMMFSTLSFSDAIILPPQTVITWPDGKTELLPASFFLLTRSDMETATLAMESLPIREKAFSDLTDSYHALQRQVFFYVVVTAIVVFSADEIYHALRR